MKIKDRVYGEEEINEQVLIDLINSEPIKRLKKISQFGLPREYYHMPSFSRYEHSLGVLILLRRLNANLNEQIAGLIHDVSHTAFSHVIDHVLGDPSKEDYQDNTFQKFIKNTKIPRILKKHGYNYKKLINYDSFLLLEQPAPLLCADRLDYSLREMVFFGLDINKDHILSRLKVIDGKIIFISKNFAEKFSKLYMQLQEKHWAGDESKLRYHIIADILKRAIDKKIISLTDLNRTDYFVINKLLESKDDFTLSKLNLLKKRIVIKETNSNEGVVLIKKYRYIDPYVLHNGKLIELSRLSSEYKELLEETKKNHFVKRKVLILEK